jgi:NitT/TauT family transport system substrate-binding protein
VVSERRLFAVTSSLFLLMVGAACTVAESARPATPPATPAAGAAPAQAAPLTPIRIVATFSSGELGPMWVALDSGLFAKHGLAVEDIAIMAVSSAYAALLGGEAQVVVGSPSSFLPAVASGADFVVVATQSNSMAYVLIALPGIGSVAELRGKQYAVGRPPGSEAIIGQQYLSARGIEVGRDYELRQIGGQPERATALQAGAADFTALSPPASTRLRLEGFSQIANLADEKIAYIGAGLNMRRSYADANPDTVERLVRAYVEGIWRFRTDRATGLDTLRRHLELDDPEILEDTYATQAAILEDVPFARPEAIVPAIEVAAETRPELREIGPSAISEMTYVRRAEASGFIRELYGR